MIPYDKRTGKIWFNGELVDWADAKIHVLNHGLHYASCVFEGERVYDNSIFKLEEHTSRLFYSAKRMGIKIPYTEEEINLASKKIISVQGVKDGYVRPTIWRGSEMMAISAQQTKTHVAIATWEWGSYFDPKLKVTKQSLNRVIKDLDKLDAILFKKDEQDTRIKHVFLNNKGKKIFDEIFDVQKKRIYNALLNSSSEEVINFDNVLKKIIDE